MGRGEKKKKVERGRKREREERELGGRPKQNQQIKNKNAKIMLCSINLKTETRVEQVTKRGGSTVERGGGGERVAQTEVPEQVKVKQLLVLEGFPKWG